jgi:VCBS repeat-containing protein
VNDTDTETALAGLTATLVDNGSKGTAVLAGNGSFTYTPNADANGQDTFTYTVTDADAGTDTSITVTVNIAAVNDAPVAVDDDLTATATINEDETFNYTGDILANDTDVDTGDTKSASADPNNPPSKGDVTINADGTFDYVPDADANGADSFGYIITDSGNLTDTGVVSIMITPVNDAPVGVADSYSVDEDAVLNVDAATGVVSNDTDAEDDGIDAVLVAGPSQATAFTLNADGSFDYEPNDDFNGQDSFTYSVTDGVNADLTPVTVTITVNPVNDAPVAVDDGYNVNEDNTLTANAVGSNAKGVLFNDTDIDTNPSLTAVLVTDVSNGTLSLN